MSSNNISSLAAGARGQPVPQRATPRGAPAAAAVAALLRPRAIAVVGASATTGTLGDRLLRAITGWDYTGQVYPVNPRYPELGGLRCYPDLAALPERVDLVAFAVNENRLPEAMTEAARHGASAAAVFSRGWVSDDAPRPTPGDRWRAIAREAGMAVCGDNCMGYINFCDRLRVSGNPVPLDAPAGGIALLSHSGSSWSAVVGSQRQLRFNYAVSVGREVVTGVADYMRFLLAQPQTRVILLLLETLRDRDGLVDAFDQANAAGVPVIALKLGRSEAGRHFARSHSGAIAGSDAACRALFAAHNVIAVRTLDEMLDTAEMFRGARVPATAAAGIGTDSGGERQLITDLADDVGLPLASFGEDTTRRLADILDPGMEPLNPVDYWGDGRLYFRECLEAIADDANVGAVVMATNMASGRKLLDTTCDTIRALARYTHKPVAKLGHVHSTIDRTAAAALREEGIPVLMGTATGLAAVKHFLAWHAQRRTSLPASPAPASTLHLWAPRLAKHAGPLAPETAFALLADAGVPLAAWRVADDVASVLAAAAALGYPLVLKSARADLLHKTEAGGVVLGLDSPPALTAAYQRMAAALGPRVLLQAEQAPGVELLLGMVRDPNLGPAVTIATGGVYAELLNDAVTVLPPLDHRQALAAIARLRGAVLLAGFRGRPPCDPDAVARAVCAFATLADALGDVLAEAEVNPLIARPDGAVAVDALFLIEPRTRLQGD